MYAAVFQCNEMQVLFSPLELFVQTADQQLMFLCVSALLTSDAGELTLKFLRLVLWGHKNKHQYAKMNFVQNWMKKLSLHTDVDDSRPPGDEHQWTLVINCESFSSSPSESIRFLGFIFPIHMVTNTDIHHLCGLRRPVSL